MTLMIILSLAIVVIAAIAMHYRDEAVKARRDLQESVEWSDSWHQLARQCGNELFKANGEIAKRDVEIERLRAAIENPIARVWRDTDDEGAFQECYEPDDEPDLLAVVDAKAILARPCGGRESQPDNTVRSG